jgi:hypothetical protein
VYPSDEQILGINSGDESAFDALLASAAENARRILDARATGSAASRSADDAHVAPPSPAANSIDESAGTEASATITAPSAAAIAALPNDAPEWLARATAAAPESASQLAAMYQRANALEIFDRAYYGADAAAQQSLVAQLYADDPAALRAMVAAAQQFIAGDANGNARVAQVSAAPFADRPEAPRSVTRNAQFSGNPQVPAENAGDLSYNNPASRDANSANAHADPAPSHANNFDPAAYAQFEQSTNDAVVADVNRAIERALDRALPNNISDGARRRIAGDTLAEVHAALRGDRDLSAQVAQMLRGAMATHPNFTTSPEALASGRTEFPRTGAAPRQEPGGSMAYSAGTQFGGASAKHSQLSASRFDSATRDAVARLIATRARTVVPEAARRVIGEWTGSVLASHRDRAAKTQAASARVDVTGGGMNSPTPRRAVAPRDINYRATSDEDILSW